MSECTNVIAITLSTTIYVLLLTAKLNLVISIFKMEQKYINISNSVNSFRAALLTTKLNLVISCLKMEQKHIKISISINTFHDAYSIVTKCTERERRIPLKSMRIHACIRPYVKAIKHSTKIFILSSRI